MLKRLWSCFVQFVHALVVFVCRAWTPWLCVLLLVFGATCSLSASDLQYSHPGVPVIAICDKPLDVPDDVKLWGYDHTTKRLVTAEVPVELRTFDSADIFFEYDPGAPFSSASQMPPEYGLTCVKPAISFPDASANFFPPSSELFRSKESCPAKVAETNFRPDPHWIADVPKGDAGCDPPKKREPKRVHVCVRPPGVPQPKADGTGGAAEWGMVFRKKDDPKKRDRWTANAADYAQGVQAAEIIFVFDANARPETAYYFVEDPKDPKGLRCPGKAAPKPYDEVVGLADLPMLAEVTAARAAQQQAKNTKGDGKTTETSSAEGKGPPLNFLEMLARNLSIAGALATGDTSGSLKDANGSRYGIPGGKNVGGPDLLLAQAAAGTFALVGNPFKSGKDFIHVVGRALNEKKVVGILDAKVLTKEMAEKLATEPEKKELEQALKGEIVDSYGKAMAMSLHEAQVILPYSRAEVFTLGWGGKYQAHHILEVNMFKKLGKEELAKDGPAVILSKAQHEAITAKLTTARTKMLDDIEKTGKRLQPADVWQMYKQVYKDYPNWLKAIEHYFQP